MKLISVNALLLIISILITFTYIEPVSHVKIVIWPEVLVNHLTKKNFYLANRKISLAEWSC